MLAISFTRFFCRSRCPFSIPIPETVCFDSTGTAVDWFFMSKMDGGIKRKLTRYDGLTHTVNETLGIAVSRCVRFRILFSRDGCLRR